MQQIKEQVLERENHLTAPAGCVSDAPVVLETRERGEWGRKSWRDVPREESKRSWRRGLS